MNAEEELLFLYTLNELLNSVSLLHISPRSSDLVLSPLIFSSG